MYRGTLHDQRGEYARAIADYERARRVAEGAGDLFRVYIVKFWESRAHTRAGDASRSRTLAEEGFALAEWIGVGPRPSGAGAPRTRLIPRPLTRD